MNHGNRIFRYHKELAALGIVIGLAMFGSPLVVAAGSFLCASAIISVRAGKFMARHG